MFYFKSIKEFDEFISKFFIMGVLGVYWLDYCLIWIFVLYGGDLQIILVFQKKVWMLFFVNMFMYDFLVEVGYSDMNVRFDSNGYIFWVVLNIFESICDVDFLYYFFDFQICFLWFYLFGYLQMEVLLFFICLIMVMLEYF